MTDASTVTDDVTSQGKVQQQTPVVAVTAYCQLCRLSFANELCPRERGELLEDTSLASVQFVQFCVLCWHRISWCDS